MGVATKLTVITGAKASSTIEPPQMRSDAGGAEPT
jgi:hypothetical protein